MMRRLVNRSSDQELYAMVLCGYVVSLSWIMQRAVTTKVATYEFAGKFLDWQTAIEPMVVYAVALLVLKTVLLFAIVGHRTNAIALTLSILTGFWVFLAFCSAGAVLDFAVNGPGTFWFNITHARNTFAGFATSLGFGLWHYFASTRDET